MSGLTKYLLSGVVILIALGALAFKYSDYLANPWTRNGQVRANVVQVATRVSGPIVKLPIKDNQLVKAGDVLFEIDPRTFQAALDQATAELDQTRDNLTAMQKAVDSASAVYDQTRSGVMEADANLKAALANLEDATVTFERNKELVAKGTISKQRFDDLKANYDVAIANKEESEAALREAASLVREADANLAQARANLGAEGEANAQLRAAKAAVKQAELDLEFTQVKASVDGYVTNLNLRLGSQAVENQPALALVDVNSFWVDAYFRETYVGSLHPGDQAVVTLMSYPDTPIEGRVESIGWGVAQEDGATGEDLLPTINPTFEWIRLAQRVPVLIELDDLPEHVNLRVGTTASVLVRTGTAGETNAGPATAAPTVLQ